MIGNPLSATSINTHIPALESRGIDVSYFGGGGGTGSPDLIVESPSVSASTLTAGQIFTLQATVRNQGRSLFDTATLHYYQSDDAIISSSDTRIGSDAVGWLSTSESSSKSNNVYAPSRAGTYYYGACVAPVSGESNTDNNCSPGVRVTVSGGDGSITYVDIPDANLRAVIADSLGKASGAPISKIEMASLNRLKAPDKDIRDLTGLEFAINLTLLDLGERFSFFNSNEISSLSPLSGLISLERLNLNSASMSDVSVLSGLTNLRELYLNSAGISDVSALSGLTNLETLWLFVNNISDVSVLSGLTNLRELGLGDNRISDVSALSGLTNLETLDLNSNNISDVSVLSGLTNLERLYLSSISISDITSLSDFTSLTDLDLEGNRISDISALSGLTNLEWLNLDNTSISDVSVLSGLTNLERLHLSSNSISDITPLSGLTSLRTLYLSSNSISDITPLSGLTSLRILFLSSNSISDITPLSGLTSLTWLDLGSNSISDLAPLVANMGLDSGDRVDVRNNPLSATSINTHIPALQGRGVEVRFGASKPAVDKKRDMPRGMMGSLEIEEWEIGGDIFRRWMEKRKDVISSK